MVVGIPEKDRVFPVKPVREYVAQCSSARMAVASASTAPICEVFWPKAVHGQILMDESAMTQLAKAVQCNEKRLSPKIQ